MTKIFISYRRQDSGAVAGKIAEALRKRFGNKNVFLDVSSIQPGARFPDTIRDAIDNADVMLVLIGKAWITEERLHHPGDFVFLEIKRGLEGRGVQVIPVLLDGAAMPRVNDLPPLLADLALRNAFALDATEGAFQSEMKRLIARFPTDKDKQEAAGDGAGCGLVGCGVAALVAVLVIAVAVIAFINNPFGSPSTPTPTATATATATSTDTVAPTLTATGTPTSSATSRNGNLGPSRVSSSTNTPYVPQLIDPTNTPVIDNGLVDPANTPVPALIDPENTPASSG